MGMGTDTYIGFSSLTSVHGPQPQRVPCSALLGVVHNGKKCICKLFVTACSCWQRRFCLSCSVRHLLAVPPNAFAVLNSNQRSKRR